MLSSAACYCHWGQALSPLPASATDRFLCQVPKFITDKALQDSLLCFNMNMLSAAMECMPCYLLKGKET